MCKARTISALLLLALGCASNKDAVDLTKPVTGAAASDAGKAYEAGLKARREQEFQDAIRYFEYVKNNFPYSQYAALAQLAEADMSFDHDEWANAATQYSEFVKGHPSHPQAAYAAYRVALAHYNDRPSDWFLLPPSYEKDQAPLRAAVDAYGKFLSNYPKSEYVPKAQIEMNDARQRLVAHDRYVAHFYEKRGEWRGAAGRYVAIAESYGDLQEGHVRADALWNAADAYRKAGDPASQRATLVRFVQESPTDQRRQQADTIIASIPADTPAKQLEPLPLPGQSPIRPVQPATPAMTPSAPAGNPAPSGPAPQPSKPSDQPGAQPPTPTPAQPDK
jgi:outer membrane protein assembly factor BamD